MTLLVVELARALVSWLGLHSGESESGGEAHNMMRRTGAQSVSTPILH